mmetsp:Transcript_4657/g.11943  ORF Transcript_4657/g.11943 Transcript_4657/m.11943 type:complete len:138 (-) Transcript_4657:9-422(-)
MCPVQSCQRIILTRTPVAHLSIEKKAIVKRGNPDAPGDVTQMSSLLSEDVVGSTLETSTPIRDSGTGILAGSWQVAKILEFDDGNDAQGEVTAPPSPKRKHRAKRVVSAMPTARIEDNQAPRSTVVIDGTSQEIYRL